LALLTGGGIRRDREKKGEKEKFVLLHLQLFSSLKGEGRFLCKHLIHPGDGREGRNNAHLPPEPVGSSSTVHCGRGEKEKKRGGKE